MIIVTCSRCGCPAGSNKTCGLCYPCNFCGHALPTPGDFCPQCEAPSFRTEHGTNSEDS